MATNLTNYKDYKLMIKKLSTKELLSASLKELSAKKTFEKITVKDIASNCNVSTTTFYHHFRDKYELVEWTYRAESEQFVKNISESYTWKDAALSTMLVLKEHLSFYRSYYRSESTIDTLNFITYAQAIDTICKRHSKESLTDDVLFSLRLYVCGVSRMAVEWILEDNAQIPPEVFVNRLMAAMPSNVRELLL